MWLKLLEVLACPECLGNLSCISLRRGSDGEIISGRLECIRCSHNYPVERGIPRFVNRDNYTSSFGYQWNYFKFEQIDSFSGKKFSGKRFFLETGWPDKWLGGKWILDVGCGAGRFLDVVSKTSCHVVGVDLSDAVEAAAVTMRARRNVHLVQASIYALPFRPGIFDGCYCIGVIQHTPDPKRAIQSLPRFLKSGGKIALTLYERKTFTILNSKYLIRPLTKRMNKKCLLLVIKIFMPVLFFLTEVLFRLPLVGKLFRFVIPVANYVDERRLSLRERYRWAILDTFDMLSPQYDYPQTQPYVENWLSETGIVDILRLDNRGLNLVGNKR